MSVRPVDAMVLSKGNLERPRKGILREKRLAEGFKEDKVWLVSVDNVAGDEIDSNGGEADGSFGTCSSIDGGVRGESTPACEPGEAALIPASGDLGCDNETGENHLRAGVIETGAISDRGRLSTRVSSGLGGVGGMTFVTGCGDSSGTEEPVEVGSIVEGSGASTGRELLGFLKDEDDVNQERLLGINLTSAPGQSALAA